MFNDIHSCGQCISNYYKLFAKNLVLYKYCCSILLHLHSIVVFGGRLEEFCKISTSVAVLCMQTRDY